MGDLNFTFLNGFSVLLTWIAPYTLESVPITGYYINSSNTTVNAANTTLVSSTDPPDPCTLTTVLVTPVNGAGLGESSNVSFYYQRGKYFY